MGNPPTIDKVQTPRSGGEEHAGSGSRWTGVNLARKGAGRFVTWAIEYTAANFVHADLALAEFTRMQKERGESLLGFALKAGKDAPDFPDFKY